MSSLRPFEPGGPLHAWRITRAEFAATALSGLGGLHVDGRWHRIGQPVVYLASSWSLAALEIFVHLGRHDSAIPFVYLALTIPPEVAVLELVEAPAGWSANPPPASTQAIGSDWLLSDFTALLKVPSALSPVEYNLILNPRHPDAAAIEASEPVRFRFDRRFWKEH